MEQDLNHTVALLSRTPAALNAFLRDLPDEWTFRNEGEKTMSVFDVVGHLIHAERTNWMPRVKMFLQFGEAQMFQSFDRWAQLRQSQGKSLCQLLDEFAHLRPGRIRLRTLGEPGQESHFAPFESLEQCCR